MRSWSLSLLVLVCLAGCSADDPGDVVSATDQELGVRNPAGTYNMTLIANGTGCPAGTWNGEISADGKTLSIRFSQYEGVLNPGQSIQVKDCALAVDLSATGGRSFAVTSFEYVGYAMLDQPGMKVRQSNKFYFKGNAVPTVDVHADASDAYNDSFQVKSSVAEKDLAWSPCGWTNRLNVQTRLLLQNNPQKSGSGYVNMGGEDADISARVRIGLALKTCDAPPPPPDCGRLEPGQTRVAGNPVVSCDGRGQLAIENGNLRLSHDGLTIWSIGFGGQRAQSLRMDKNGDFFVAGTMGSPLWDTGTGGHPDAYLKVEDDCRLTVYGPRSEVLWRSATRCGL